MLVSATTVVASVAATIVASITAAVVASLTTFIVGSSRPVTSASCAFAGRAEVAAVCSPHNALLLPSVALHGWGWWLASHGSS